MERAWPWTLIHFKLVTITHEVPHTQVFHSFYEEIRNELSISAKAKNLFLLLGESIAQTLNVTSCYVCGRPTWETIGLGKQGSWTHKSLLMRLLFQNTKKACDSWNLPSFRNYFICHSEGQFSTSMVDLTCLGQKFYNDTSQETQLMGSS
jgi:hypothetical protein